MATTETDKLDGAVTGEVRLLIDGELTEAESGKRFDNINPATEEVLGQVADASAGRHGEGHRGGAPRLRRDRLVDEPRVPAALPRAAASGDRERARGVPRRAGRRSRDPDHPHVRPAARRATRRRAPLARAVHRQVRMGAQAARRSRLRWPRGPDGREGGRGSGRRDRALELPARSHAAEGGPGAGNGQHHDPQARARHAVERDPPRPARRRAHRHPGGCVQRDRARRITSSARSWSSTRASTSSRSPARPSPAGASWRRARRR